MSSHFKPEFFRRIDDSEDELFYSAPRFVVHIDDGAIRKVGEIYAQLLPQGGDILDLMSSWRTHLPDHVRASRVVGLGLNRAEMEDNPQLTAAVVHNVNKNPRLPFDDAIFDGAIMTVSVQYLIHPVETFAEVGRVLKPRAPFIVTFSNRMFPTKAVAVWQYLNESDRVGLVGGYFKESGAFEHIGAIDKSAPTEPPSDPVYAAVGHRIAR
ncbi:MAG TPA: methyltransferase domain-containing protein [Candidatus Binataceae bacterium]|nr:methyltransferase domain-containing protein [Candidatus Binataceae bacterium]